MGRWSCLTDVYLDSWKRWSKIPSGMVYQPLETRIERLEKHVEVVSAHYRRALANVEFYPEATKERLGNQIGTEYDSFNKAAELVREGRFVREIQDRVCAEARSWVKGNIPAAIARYSFYQVSDEELEQRSKVSREQRKICKTQLASALDTIEKLSKHDGDPRKTIVKKARKEFSAFKRAFTLYERGFSFVEIKALTGESIQSRVEDRTIPETILQFAGYPLSADEAEARKKQIIKLSTAAVKAHQEATEKQKERDPHELRQQLKTWQAELRKLKLVFDLYEKGLAMASIDNLTGLNAGSWIKDGTLPVKLAYARRDGLQRDFVVPTHFDSNVAFIVGALFGTTRVFSREYSISFRHPDLAQVVDIRERFQRAFSTSLVEPTPEGKGYTLRVGRSLLVREFFDRLGIVDGASDCVPPFDLIKYSDTCRAFVLGFLTFSKPFVDVDRHIFHVARRNQPTILKVVAAGLYLEKIYPIVRENDQSVSLTISAQREFDSLCDFAPAILSAQEKDTLAARSPSEEDPLGSYTAYQRVSEVLRRLYPKGVKLNFEDILRRAGIECEVTKDMKTRIAYWRSGRKPYVAQRAEAVERILGSLYPDAKTEQASP